MGVLLLVACTPHVVTVTVTSPPETVVVTATPSPSPVPTPTPVPATPGTLTVCLPGEPDTLYLYGGSRLPAAQHVMAALYDGPVDYVDYAYHPVILEDLPSIDNGDAVIRRTWVRTGSRVVDATGEIVELISDAAILVRPAGCYDAACAVEFEGEPLVMDRLEVTFTLRDDVMWADGEPLTAADSVFGFEVAADPRTPVDHNLTDRTLTYRALGQQRVRWVGLPGFIDREYALNFFPPLPAHQLAGRSPVALAQDDETRRMPLGWGPFVVQEWIAGEQITLVRNPHYFRAREGLPYLERLVFRFSANSPAMVADLLAGTCDLVPHDDLDALLPLLLAAEEAGLLQVAAVAGAQTEWLDIGIASSADAPRPDLFGDVQVRQALAQCIDRQAMVEALTYGLGAVPRSYLPVSHPLGSDVRTSQWPYNPAAGRRLLEQAGWLDEDGDGILEATGVTGVRAGTPFEATLLYAADEPLSERIARIIRADLMDCGMRVALEGRLAEDLAAAAPDGPIYGRRFDLALRSRPFVDADECRRYVSAEVPDEDRPYGQNVAGFGNGDYDEACSAALGELPGSAAYAEDQARAQLLFAEALPAVPLFMRLRVAALRLDLANFRLDATSESELWNIESVDLDG
jgi:peptide/nickel transport system substrate-binding protein